MRSSLRRGWSGQSVLTIQMESALRYCMSSNKRLQSNEKITLDLQLTPKGEPVVDPGEGLGGLGPPPYFYTSEARRAGKCFFETGPPISAPPPHPLSEGLDYWEQSGWGSGFICPQNRQERRIAGEMMKIKYVRQNSGILTPTPLFHLPEFISLILVYLDFRGGRERESRTYCGKQQANLGFASASQTFNEKSFSRRVFLVKRWKASQRLEWDSFVYFSLNE